MPADHHSRFVHDPIYRAAYMKHHEVAERAPRPTYHGSPYSGPHGANLGHMPGHVGISGATPHPRGSAVRDAGRSGGIGKGIHRDNHGRFA